MKRVLVVEDHPANLKLVRLLLEQSGHEVVTADNATDGMRLASETHPDVILMDIQLPGIDGLEATRLLKKDPLTSHIPVIALTAFAMADDADRIRAAGCDAYLAKPFRRGKLLEAVAEALSLRL